MSRSTASDTTSGNTQFKRGEVVENDPKTGRSKVKFADEDDVSTMWIHWNMAASKDSKVYDQPDIGAQVHCLIDGHGEDGIILGSPYSDTDKPPTENGDLLKATLKGGLDLEYDKSSGTLKLTCPTRIELTVGESKITMEPGELVVKGAKIQTDGPTHLNKGTQQVHRVGDIDSDLDAAVTGADKVFA